MLGACAGILLGCLGAVGWGGINHLPDTVVARVNGTDIQMVEYQRALKLFGSEKREPIADKDRSLVLERMIEEELLLQHGMSSGLVRRDRDVRMAALQSILTGLMVEFEADAKGFQDGSDSPNKAQHTSATERELSAGKSRDALLGAYLGQLREASTIIRWVTAGAQR